MQDTGFQVFFWLVCGMIVLGAIITAFAAFVHFAIFGAAIGLIVRRIGVRHTRPAESRTERRCSHCKSLVSMGVAECPNCGAPTV